MNMRAIAGKTIAAVALAGAFAGLATGVADARPTTGHLRDSCADAGGTWSMNGYTEGGRYKLLGYFCDLGGGGFMTYDSDGNYVGG